MAATGRQSEVLAACARLRARAITIRLIGYQPSLDRMFSAWNTIERTRFD